MCETERSNSRFRRAAPKVGSWRCRAKTCCSISGEVFVGAMPMGAAVLAQPRRPLLLIATEPLPHRGHRSSEGSGGRFDAVLAGVLD
jgi:hypothetical protein